MHKCIPSVNTKRLSLPLQLSLVSLIQLCCTDQKPPMQSRIGVVSTAAPGLLTALTVIFWPFIVRMSFIISFCGHPLASQGRLCSPRYTEPLSWIDAKFYKMLFLCLLKIPSFFTSVDMVNLQRLTFKTFTKPLWFGSRVSPGGSLLKTGTSYNAPTRW